MLSRRVLRSTGAASMGALRAAELHGFGMVGHGRIFEWYRDGVIDADDEVALIYGPEEVGYPSLSKPLVNIRATLAAAVPDRLAGGVPSADRACQSAPLSRALSSRPCSRVRWPRPGPPLAAPGSPNSRAESR